MTTAARWLLRACRWAPKLGASFVFLAGAASADSGDSPSGLDVVAELVSQEYCSSAAPSVQLDLRIRLRIENRDDTPAIVAAPPQFLYDKVVAVTPVEGDSGVYVAEYDSTPSTVVPTPEKSFKRKPGPDFLVIEAGGTRTIEVETRIRAWGKEKARDAMMREGSAYVLKLALLWSVPFEGLTARQLASLEKRWRPYGRIVTGVGWANWVSFTAPELPTSDLPSCGAHESSW